jgi:hypothetical protein
MLTTPEYPVPDAMVWYLYHEVERNLSLFLILTVGE